MSAANEKPRAQTPVVANPGAKQDSPDLSGRKRRGARALERVFKALTLLPILIALVVIMLLLADVIGNSVSWQVVKPRGSGESFSFFSGFGGLGTWQRVVKLELAAQGLDDGEVAALLNDPVERRRFAARHRVELMWVAGASPLRWVVTSTRDQRVATYPVTVGRTELAEVRADLQLGERLYLNPWLDLGFFVKRASRSPLMSGLAPALLGSLWVIGLVILIAVPIGLFAAIYLEEYAVDNFFTRLLEVNLRNLAGVPSVVYGILGLTVFVRLMRLGPTVLAAALTLSLLVIPVVIIASREAIKAVPNSMRLAGYGLGATRSQVAFRVVLPSALPGVVTGVILSVARAFGETAPLLLVGAVGFIPGVPNGPLSLFTVLPVQIYSWVGANEPEFAHVASAGIVVLLSLLVVLYGLAYKLRKRFARGT